MTAWPANMPEPTWRSADDSVLLYHGDVRDTLRAMPDQSVNCCVTSPPYWGLRDYGTATWEGGDAECDHKDARQAARNLNHSASEQRQGRTASEGKLRDGIASVSATCAKCGARRIDRQLGLERTPDEYVANMVAVFREVRRVLRDDGTVWLNLGDIYATSPPGNKASGLEKWKTSGLHGARISEKYAETLDRSAGQKRSTVAGGLKPKDLAGIPWMVAFALRDDGWYLRSDIIWSKPNPMPESVRDRPTKAHEYVFLLSKSERYYYDADAIAEPSLHEGRVVEYDGTQKMARVDATLQRTTIGGPGGSQRVEVGPTRNRRSVWTVTTKPYRGAHFATFPPDLIEPCILAGCPEGGVVLDPFAGSCTTGQVAVNLGRRAVLCELNAEYCELGKRRMRPAIERHAGGPMFADAPDPQGSLL